MKHPITESKFENLVVRTNQDEFINEGAKKELITFINFHRSFQMNKGINWF